MYPDPLRAYDLCHTKKLRHGGGFYSVVSAFILEARERLGLPNTQSNDLTGESAYEDREQGQLCQVAR